MTKPVVSKFGGSSLADAGQFKKIRYIIEQNPNRRYIVPSAPGKRNPDDVKVTDLLYACYDKAKHGEDYTEALEKIRGRYQEIIRSQIWALVMGIRTLSRAYKMISLYKVNASVI